MEEEKENKKSNTEKEKAKPKEKESSKSKEPKEAGKEKEKKSANEKDPAPKKEESRPKSDSEHILELIRPIFQKELTSFQKQNASNDIISSAGSLGVCFLHY